MNLLIFYKLCVNEQYEYMHETYGSVEMYTIYNLLLFIGLPMPLPDTLIDYMCLYIFKIVVCHKFLFFKYMSAVVIGSVNCRGLSNNVKRCDILNKCRDTVCMIYHSIKQREKQWQHEWGYMSRFGSHSSASRG